MGLKDVDVNISASALAEGFLDITTNGIHSVVGKKEVNVQIPVNGVLRVHSRANTYITSTQSNGQLGQALFLLK